MSLDVSPTHTLERHGIGVFLYRQGISGYKVVSQDYHWIVRHPRWERAVPKLGDALYPTMTAAVNTAITQVIMEAIGEHHHRKMVGIDDSPLPSKDLMDMGYKMDDIDRKLKSEAREHWEYQEALTKAKADAGLLKGQHQPKALSEEEQQQLKAPYGASRTSAKLWDKMKANSDTAMQQTDAGAVPQPETEPAKSPYGGYAASIGIRNRAMMALHHRGVPDTTIASLQYQDIDVVGQRITHRAGLAPAIPPGGLTMDLQIMCRLTMWMLIRGSVLPGALFCEVAGDGSMRAGPMGWVKPISTNTVKAVVERSDDGCPF